MELAFFKPVLQKPKGANNLSIPMFELAKVLWGAPVQGAVSDKLVTRY